MTALLPVAVWTVDEEARMRELMDMGVHSITTNRVSRLVELRKNHSLVTKWR